MKTTLLGLASYLFFGIVLPSSNIGDSTSKNGEELKMKLETTKQTEDAWTSATRNWVKINPTLSQMIHSATIQAMEGIQSGDPLNIQEVLDAHNILREEVGVPPLVWSEELAGEAENWAKKVAEKNRGDAWVLEHSGSGRGENIAGGFVSGDSPA